MRTIVLACFATLLAMTARAESVAAPRLSPNDSRSYQHTVETRPAGWRQTQVESTVLRAGSTSITMSSHLVGSTMPPTRQLCGPGWSRFRSANGVRNERFADELEAFEVSN